MSSAAPNANANNAEPKLLKHSFGAPTMQKTMDKTICDIVQMGPHTAMRVTLQPGWTWCNCVRPNLPQEAQAGEKGKFCQKPHFGFLQQGQLEVWTDTNERMTINAGDSYVIQPGHDAKVLGNSEAIGFEFDKATAESYGAK